MSAWWLFYFRSFQMSFSFFDWFNFVLVRHFNVKLALDNWRDFLHLLNNLNAAQHHLKQKLKIIERDTLECVDIGATLETLKRQNLLNLKREGNTESAKRRCLRWTHSHWATPLHSKLEKKKWYDRERAAFVRSFVHSLVERPVQKISKSMFSFFFADVGPTNSNYYFFHISNACVVVKYVEVWG